VSRRAYCPGCDGEFSAIWSAFSRGRPCPECGLSATAAEEIMAVRARQGDAKLKAELEEALKQVDKLTEENRRLLWKVAHVQEAISSEPPDPIA
jgi:hypothetical protein